MTRRPPALVVAALLMAALLIAALLTGCGGGSSSEAGAASTESSSGATSASTDDSTGTADPRGPDAPGATASSGTPAEPSLLLATQAASDGLVWIDPSIRDGSAVVHRVAVGGAPWGIAVHEPSRTAYVSTAEGVAVVDLAARRRTALVPYRNQPASVTYGEFRAGGMGIAVAPDGSRVYVAVHRERGNAVLEVLDTTRGEIVDAVKVGMRPFDVDISADGEQVFTVDHDSFTVHVVDTDPLVARSHEVAPFGTEGGLASWEKPHYAVVAPDGDLLLPYQGEALVRLDPATGRASTSELHADTHQHGVTRTEGGLLLIVGTGPFGSAEAGPSLTILEPGSDGSGEEEVVVSLERLHETVTTWRDPRNSRQYAVLAGGYTRDGWWDGATLVDLGSHETREIEIPGRPQAIVPLPAR